MKDESVRSDLLGQGLIKLSVSKTKTFLDCKAKYKFAYIHKLPRKDRDFHVLGRFVHSVLENFYLNYLNGSTLKPSEMMKDCFKKCLPEYQHQMTDAIKKEARQILIDYLESLALDMQDIKRIKSVEKNFNIEVIPGVTLVGMIDRIHIDDDGIMHVADYKTTKNIKYIKNDYFQLLTYCYVLMKENPEIEKIRASYILLRHKSKWLTKEFGRSEVFEIEKEYDKYSSQVFDEELFEPSPSPLCSYCDYLDHCSEGRRRIGGFSNYGQGSWG